MTKLYLSDEVIDTIIENIEKELDEAMFKTSLAFMDERVKRIQKYTEVLHEQTKKLTSSTVESSEISQLQLYFLNNAS